MRVDVIPGTSGAELLTQDVHVMSLVTLSYTCQCLQSECLVFRFSLLRRVDQHGHRGTLATDSKVMSRGFPNRRSVGMHWLKGDRLTSSRGQEVSCRYVLLTVMGLLGVLGSGVEGVPRTWLPSSDTRTRHALHRETHILIPSVRALNDQLTFWQQF